MGSNFQSQARKARHPAAPPAYRAHAFGSCVKCFVYLTRQSYTATEARLAARFGYSHRRDASIEQLMASLDALEVERNHFLQRLSAFARRRITQKHLGQRTPTRAEVAVLYAPLFTKPISNITRMDIPKQFSDYPCSDYFASERFTRGVWSELEQLWLVVSAEEVVEDPKREFLVVGRPGVDGIEFGYRRWHYGIWAHYPIEDDFRLVAPSVSALVKGWLEGRIKV